MDNILERISIDPKVCFGKPCIKGTRIWVSLLLDFLGNGDTEEELLKAYPQLTHEDILAAIAYGAEAARERIIPVPAQPRCAPLCDSNLTKTSGHAASSCCDRPDTMSRPFAAKASVGPATRPSSKRASPNSEP
jgi:uncharacterized protein (DUF433 family)